MFAAGVSSVGEEFICELARLLIEDRRKTCSDIGLGHLTRAASQTPSGIGRMSMMCREND